MHYKILNRKRHWIYFSLLLIGILLLIWEIELYRKTIIDIKIPVLIIVITGTIGYLLDKEKYIQTYEMDYKEGFAWLQYTLSWGFMACTLFMVLNKYLSDEQLKVETYQIDNTSTMSSKPRGKRNERPLVRILYEGKIKELVFSNKYLIDLKEYKSVTLETKNGLFGYDVIVKQTLNKSG